MNLTEVCRVCLRTDRTLCSLVESIVPKFELTPNSVMDQWKLFTKMLIAPEDRFADKICIECLYEIRRTYSFILKCERSEDILKKMKNDEICFKGLKMVSVLCEHNISKNIKFEDETYPNISQIKTESIERDRINVGHNEDTDRGQFEVLIEADGGKQTYPPSQDTIMTQHKDDHFDIELLDLCDWKNDVRQVEVFPTQDIKYEPELDITSMENDEFDEIESDDKSSTEIFQCPRPACRHQFKMMDSLENHVIENHMEGQLCKLCHREFKGTAIEHRVTHLHMNSTQKMTKSTNRKHFKCKVCLKIFGWKYALNAHSKMHTGEKPFKCEICSKTFGNKSILRRHLICHTGGKPFKCEICPKAYRQKISLTEHLRCHTGENPFKCRICPKTFGYKSNLRRHLSSHAGEKLFRCEICPKAYRQKISLTVHVRSHTGERPFSCEICLKTFRQKSYLTKHFRRHTERENDR